MDIFSLLTCFVPIVIIATIIYVVLQASRGKFKFLKNNVGGVLPVEDSVSKKQTVMAQDKQSINISINADEIKSQAATEIVDVPQGVIVKVKRVRTIEHTVNIEWVTALSGKGEITLQQVLSASIQGEIQRHKGYTSQQTESREYEITLNGEKHNKYKLIWVDIWLKGVAEVQNVNQPFEFRDRTELKVEPYTIS
jgi:hypothetical protein